MQQLKMKNPQVANQMQEMINSKQDPMELFKKLTNNFDENKKEQFFNQARMFGFNEELLNQVKNGINSKWVWYK